MGRPFASRTSLRRALVAVAAPAAGASEPVVSAASAASVRDDVRAFLGSWWPEIALGLVVLAMLLARLARRKPVRRLSRYRLLRGLPPRLRLAVRVEQASASDPDVADGFAGRIRSQMRDSSARYASDPRVVYGSDAPVDVPLDGLPAQAKFLAALWRWFRRSNTVTLQVTLLPAAKEGVACHVVLLEADGSVVRGVRVPDRVLQYRPAAWEFDPGGATWCSLQWMPLANLATAWGLFAFRSLQVPPVQLAEEFGTASGEAYLEMLAGLEHGDTPTAMRHYRRAVEIDPAFLEAHLNLASALGNWTEEGLQAENLAEAEQILRDVLAHVPPGDLERTRTADKATVRWRSLWLRASYSLAMVRCNRLTAAIGQVPADDRVSPGAGNLLRDVTLLDEAVLPATAARGWLPTGPGQSGTGEPPGASAAPAGESRWIRWRDRRRQRRAQSRAVRRRLRQEHDPLITLRRQMEPHVRLLLAGAVLLQDQLAPPSGRQHLPLDLDPDGVPCSCANPAAPGSRHEPTCRRSAVAILRGVRMTGTPTRIHYTLACTWARDERSRAQRPSGALERCAQRLGAALEDRDYRERWPHDPDLRPLAGELLPVLHDGPADSSAERPHSADDAETGGPGVPPEVAAGRVPPQKASEVTRAR